ncbi:VWA domain-containing protein, partial [Candidatus Bathyarchaeota archaeon]|nr:VWA domain-containing protein [Candidatus Bathyarchaeota archaeon]
GKIKIEAKGKKVSKNVGKRAESVTALHRGRPFSWRFPKGKPRDIHLPASLRAAAKRQIQRKEKATGLAIQISLEDVREKLRLYKAPATIIFVIDLSGSMLYDIDSVKEAILRLHSDAYRYRDKVGIVALKDFGAVIVQHPITNLRVVANKLSNLRVSGYTPLAAGMLKGLEVIKAAKRRDPSMIPLMVIITDGNANVPLKRSLETGEIRHFDEVSVATREFEDFAVRDVVSVSKIIRREGISTVVINTNPHIHGRESYGLLVTRMIASITKGTHYEVGRTWEKQELTDRIFERIDNSRKIIFSRTKLSNFNVHPLFD